jgi:competence protein ComEC
VLIAPHHGSKTSSSTKFLNAVQPDTVLIPAGYRNAFGHPHQLVLSRYHAINADWLNTADRGAINLQLRNNNVSITTMRDSESRYWNTQ